MFIIHLILGIGLNTKGLLKDYPIELQDIITTLEEEILSNPNFIKRYKKELPLKNEKIFQEILTELDSYFKNFNKEKNNSMSTKNSYLNQKLLIKEWLERSQAIGTKVRFFENNVENKNHENTGIIEGLTNEGFLKIKSHSGKIITHVAGDVIEIKKVKK